MEIIVIGPEHFREQQHNKPIEIKDQEMFDKILNYIHQNPVVAGFVTKPEDWKYSSAGDFCEMKGLVELSYSLQVGTRSQAAKPTPHSCANSGNRFCLLSNKIQ